ncbi:Cof-type HAD-IIB family hydrolase [Lysinibacillus piscis]|uniref:Haloacid dehalogenase n=1 Tax=Lysinibacillus piscis TaxID=2518931 RepID=A0ABQ5NNV5_9BACI|nr:Cof-type HAD-IIB family hydrolase [Lysinibacillus sp. KH24]GLC90040.1 haloacid dehalogenase [Lysinibacillus sp. KH24]
MQYKLVVLDMDGTLLNDNHGVSEANKEAIHRIKKMGVGVTVASGRTYESIYPFIEDLGIDLPIIAANGAFIKNPLSGEVYYSESLPRHLAEEIIEYGQKHQFEMSLYLDAEVHTFNESMAKVHLELEKLQAKLIDKFDSDKELYKIIYGQTPEKIEEACEYLADKYKDSLYITRSADMCLDVMNMNVSKGNGLQQVMEKLHISPEEVIVMGNSFNDLPMFEVAGLAIAMDNAPQEVKNMADFVTISNNDDGVAHALTKFIG